MERKTGLGKFTRRSFLATTAAGLSVSAMQSFEQNPLGGIISALSRPHLSEITNLAPEMEKIPVEVYHQAWLDHFNQQSDLMRFDAWYVNFSEKHHFGIGQHLAGLASTYYQTEKLPDESWPEYYQRYLTQLHDLADQANLDFTVLATTLMISSENMASQPVKKDIDESRVQAAVIPLVRAMGLEYPFLESISQSGWVSQILRQKDIDDFHGLPQMGMSFFDTIRFRNVETTGGEMDYETGKKAEYYAESPEPVKTLFAEQFPEIAQKYDEINHGHQQLIERRNQLKLYAQTYLKLYPNSLDLFRSADPDALSAIGLGEEIDPWQTHNYTFAWLEKIKTYDDGQLSSHQISSAIKSYAQENPDEFGIQFMSQQIFNPKFLNYLKKQAKSSQEQAILDQMTSLKDSYHPILNKQIERIQTTHHLEGQYELNSYFQNLTTVIITKALSDKAGPFKQEINSISNHIAKVGGMREIPPAKKLVFGSLFGRDARIDTPYAPDDVLQIYEDFTKFVKLYGLIDQEPEKDILPFLQLVEILTYRNRGTLPEMADQKWATLIKQFDGNFTARLYVSNISCEDLTKSPHFAEFEELLLKNRIIFTRFSDQRDSFYEALINVASNKYDVYYWLDEDQRAEIQQFLTTKAPQLIDHVKTNKITWHTYPPFNRSQTILKRLLVL